MLFAKGQTFPTVSSLNAGDGSILIGGTTSAPTVRVGQITNANVADGALDPAKIAQRVALLTRSNNFNADQFISQANLFISNDPDPGSQMLIGDVGCGTSGFLGLDMTPAASSNPSCRTYAIGSAGADTFVNAPPAISGNPNSGKIFFRQNNVTRMTIDSGEVSFQGSVNKQGGGFLIDHPLDPANKYLNHSFVESPDMKNIYDGIVVLDAKGEAEVTLADWFGALNRDFRYQLTAIGAPGPNLYIAEKISNNRFKIAGGAPGGKVSWQVTGIRQDAYANIHRIPVEEDKPAAEKGTYLSPDLFAAPPERALRAWHGPTARRSQSTASR
jgi:hypothetical protein